MGKQTKDKWIKLGEVGVESGQLLVTDPCYIDSEWQKDDVKYTRKLYDTKLKTYIPSPNDLRDKAFKWDIQYADGMTYNEAMEAGRLVQEPERPTGFYSYNGCCKASVSKHGGGLNHQGGRPGAGVSFPIGAGDSRHGVYALVDEVEGWGKRIKEIRIAFIE